MTQNNDTWSRFALKFTGSDIEDKDLKSVWEFIDQEIRQAKIEVLEEIKQNYDIMWEYPNDDRIVYVYDIEDKLKEIKNEPSGISG